MADVFTDNGFCYDDYQVYLLPPRIQQMYWNDKMDIMLRIAYKFIKHYKELNENKTFYRDETRLKTEQEFIKQQLINISIRQNINIELLSDSELMGTHVIEEKLATRVSQVLTQLDSFYSEEDKKEEKESIQDLISEVLTI